MSDIECNSSEFSVDERYWGGEVSREELEKEMMTLVNTEKKENPFCSQKRCRLVLDGLVFMVFCAMLLATGLFLMRYLESLQGKTFEIPPQTSIEEPIISN